VIAQKVKIHPKVKENSRRISKRSYRFHKALKSAERIVDHPNEKGSMERQKAMMTLQSAEKAQH
jgi:hypothetical protein